MRRQYGFTATEVLDPRTLAARMKATIVTPEMVRGLPKGALRQLLSTDKNGWSAACMSIPGGRVVIVCNPTHASTRTNATIMEELAHVFLRHTGTELAIDGSGATFRTYRKSEETAAYWVGAAVLLPRAVLAAAKRAGVGAIDLARTRGVSSAVVRFRQQITGVRLAS